MADNISRKNIIVFAMLGVLLFVIDLMMRLDNVAMSISFLSIQLIAVLLIIASLGLYLLVFLESDFEGYDEPTDEEIIVPKKNQLSIPLRMFPKFLLAFQARIPKRRRQFIMR
ncbi:MAG: hypothetical protein IH840_02875 [Candidatus Heimdallarchaeota archaeon]|nr:hypothetical protein [Candidatus Heimdallarchaeota archaeon]